MADTRGSVQVIDTHAHLDHERFRDDLDDVIARAKAAGVWPVIEVGSDLATSRAALGLVRRYRGLLAAVGIHPHEAKTASNAALEELRAMAREPGVAAIGEIGLDYHYDFSPRDQQRRAFAAQIAIAKDVGLPIVVHDREAHADTLAILKSEGAAAVGGVIHCFSGDWKLARSVLDMGFYISVGGTLTFPNATSLRDLVARLPLDRLLLETDCPYLTPVPHRGKRNEPAFVVLVAEELARLKRLDVHEVAAATTRNARVLFRLQSESARH
ncbi:MAG: TatD DNase family protein [Bacillota bacterium]|nr:TatD DNase family protein [Bacillota bacterium]